MYLLSRARECDIWLKGRRKFTLLHTCIIIWLILYRYKTDMHIQKLRIRSLYNLKIWKLSGYSLLLIITFLTRCQYYRIIKSIYYEIFTETRELI